MAYWIIEDKGFGGMNYTCSNCEEVWNELWHQEAGGERCPNCNEFMDENFIVYVDEKAHKKAYNVDFVEILHSLNFAKAKERLDTYNEILGNTDSSSHESQLYEYVQKLEMLSGMKIDKLVELFAAGWTLKPPATVMGSSTDIILNIQKADIEEEIRRAGYLNAGERVIPPLKLNFEQLNHPPKEIIAARDKFFEECDKLDVEAKDGVVSVEIEEPLTKKYRIDIWVRGRIVESYEFDNIEEVLDWYRSRWKHIYDGGGCVFEIFENNKKLTFKEQSELGFYE